jgi:hypothetical protein
VAQQINRIRPDGTRGYDSTEHGQYADGKNLEQRTILLGNLLISRMFQ